jgi:1-deoxy-D-xylulose-5-phosphate reductoisomerase
MSLQQKKNIAILGSTGSIGTQALEVVRALPGMFSIELLTAHSNAGLLIGQAREFLPNAVVIADESRYEEVSRELSPLDIKVFAGYTAIEQAVQMDSIDMVLTALVGFAGLRPTMAAIQAGKNIALANKETLVVAGDLITAMAREKGVNIYPVDSEHSAIFQCLAGEFQNPVEKIILTASGGPFRGYPKERLQSVTADQALKHPNWSMGSKITIDSASLMNKGLEVIEAKWLFGLNPEQIEVVIHPQSIIHSMVQFQDGSMKAQMGLPDMKLPIQYALSYPQRLKNDFPRFSFTKCESLTFEAPDTNAFPNLRLAYEALKKGGNMPCILNASNEIAVAEFLKGTITFSDMPVVIEECMQRSAYVANPGIQDYLQSDTDARVMTQSLIHTIQNKMTFPLKSKFTI